MPLTKKGLVVAWDPHEGGRTITGPAPVRADNGVRTRGLDLGKVALYLSELHPHEATCD